MFRSANATSVPGATGVLSANATSVPSANATGVPSAISVPSANSTVRMQLVYVPSALGASPHMHQLCCTHMHFGASPLMHQLCCTYMQHATCTHSIAHARSLHTLHRACTQSAQT